MNDVSGFVLEILFSVLMKSCDENDLFKKLTADPKKPASPIRTGLSSLKLWEKK